MSPADWRLRRGFYLGLTLFVAALLLVALVSLSRLHADALENASLHADAHARNVEALLTKTLSFTDLVTVATLKRVEPTQPLGRLDQFFGAALSDAPFLRSVSIIDEQGSIVESSNPHNIGKQRDMAGFLPPARPGLGGVRVGLPLQGRDFADADLESPTGISPESVYFVPLLSQRLLEEGEVALLAALNPEYFINQILQNLPIEHGVVDILRYDDIVLMSSDPHISPGAPGRRPTDTETGEHRSGGREFLSAYQVSSRYPVAVAVHLDRSHALVGYRDGTRTILIALIPALLMIISLAVLYDWRRVQLSARQEETERLQRLNTAQVFNATSEGIIITDADGTISDVNQAFTRITGYSREEALGRNPRFLQSGLQSDDFHRDMWRTLLANDHWEGEYWNRRKDGRTYPQMSYISVVRDARQAVRHFIALVSDVTGLNETREHLQRLAHQDALTGLPNRILFADRLSQAMSQSRRSSRPLLVGYLDLDGFKAVNDTLGHRAGDDLLILIAKRIRETLRAGDTLARLGGDEFVVVLMETAVDDRGKIVLQRILEAATHTVDHAGAGLSVSASLGVTVYPQEEEVDADQLLRQADQAMYKAKLNGKGRYQLFNASQDRHARDLAALIAAIRIALEEDQLTLYYQPKVNLRTGTVFGFEALIRWRHPVRGLLLPGEFLTPFESHPIGIMLGQWVIEHALTQLESWMAQNLDLSVGINVSAVQLQDPAFAERLASCLARHPRVNPARVEIEILESSAVTDMSSVSKAIKECGRLGVRFSLDDFGTGYSTLTYLKRLPVHALKIDRSFVRDMLIDPDDLTIVQGIIGLAEGFRHEAIAEGVETEEQAELLVGLGCDLAQGYFVARPMPAELLPGWIRDWRPPHDWATLGVIPGPERALVAACVEHRAWLNDAASYLRGESRDAPSSDVDADSLATWLSCQTADTASSVEVRQVLSRIAGLHAESRALAAGLLVNASMAAGSEPIDSGELKLGAERLYAFADELYQHVMVLVRLRLV